ncbi:hypothetical protein STANM309S_01417 [Streptomyces tanashiensis]
MAAMQLTRTHRILIGLVIGGALIIAGIGFAGSYAAVRELALQKGFGTFSYFFPIGIDAGICVLLALDLLLTWLRIPFPLLRQTAWVLTAATIAFNGAAAWPDPLGVGMHAVIPVLFVVAVEAARHAVGRIADITADKHMEGVRITRWLLSPVPTFRLWRRMKLWELRSVRAGHQAGAGAADLPGPAAGALRPRLAAQGAGGGADAAAARPVRGAARGDGPGGPGGGGHRAGGTPSGAAAGRARAAPAGGAAGPGPGAGRPGADPGGAAGPGAAAGAGPGGAGEPREPLVRRLAGLPGVLRGQLYNPQIVEGLEPMPVPVPQGPEDVPPAGPEEFVEYPEYVEQPEPRADEFEDVVYKVMSSYVIEHERFPAEAELARLVAEQYGLPEFPASDIDLLRQAVPAAQERVQQARADVDTP